MKCVCATHIKSHSLFFPQDDDVEALFDSLEPSLRHEQLACYVFSLRFIQAAMIFYGYRGDCPVNLYQYAPQQVIKFVVNDAKGLIDQIPLECDGSKNRDKLQAKLDLVRKYCQLIIDKTQSRALQSVFEGVQIEFERFAIDPHYKISIVYSMMSSLDHELIMRSLAASDKLELDKEDVNILRECV